MARRTVPGTPAWLRTRNDRAALQLLLDHGTLTRNQLGELTGLSKPTASQMVQRLESADLVHAVGAVSGGRGPNAASYAVRSDAALGVAVDITVDALRAAVVDTAGTPHPVVEVALHGDDRSPAADVRRAIAQASAYAGIDPVRIQAVCVGVQGSIDPRTDRLRFADTLPGWPAVGVRSRLEADLRIGVSIENDVNLAAVAERAGGAGAGTDGFVLLWLGEGLGLGIDVGGDVQRGASGGAGEIGYLPVPRAASAFDEHAEELQDLIGGIPVARLAGAGDYAAALVALRRDPALRASVVAQLAPRVALGLAPVLALLDPERIVLGGPTGAAGGPALAAAVAERVRRDTQWHPEVSATGIPTHPVLAGARVQLTATLRATLFDRLDRTTV